jgi:arsenite methyltransferase
MNFLNPKKIISQMLSLEDSLVADFGFGSGEFLRFLSKSAGEGGRVYAIDIQPEIVKKISKDFDEENITNTNFLTVDLEKNKSTDISENSLDFVLLSSVLFQSDKKESILKETLRVLRPGGRLLLID